MQIRKKFLTFNAIVWVICIIAALGIAFGPLAFEAFARYTWQKIPCYESPTAARFIFQFKGKNYYCGRINFWHNRNTSPELAIQNEIPPDSNSVCYVNGSDPPQAVLRFDAYQHLSQGVGYFASAAMILVVCALITSIKPRAAAPRASPQANSR